MKRLTPLLFAALALASCATTVAIKCGLQDIQIAAGEYAEIHADVQSRNWSDLAQLAWQIGWGTVNCALGEQATKHPELKPNVDGFRRLHSVELRSAGVAALCAPPNPSLNAAPPAPSMASTGATAGGSADLRKSGVMTRPGEPVALRSPGDPTPRTSCDPDHPCARRRSLDPEDGFAFDRAPPGVGPGPAAAGGK